MPKAVIAFLFTTFRTTCEITSQCFFFAPARKQHVRFHSSPRLDVLHTQKSPWRCVWRWGQEKLSRDKEKDRDGQQFPSGANDIIYDVEVS